LKGLSEIFLFLRLGGKGKAESPLLSAEWERRGLGRKKTLHRVERVDTIVNMEVSRSLKTGDPAPDFELKDQHGGSVRLSEFLGKKNVVLAFYVLAFTGG
jgi:hypothetical protein